MMEVLVGIAVAILLFVVGLRIRAGTITIADFTGLLTGLGVLAGPARRLGGSFASVQQGGAALDRVFMLFDAENTIRDGPDKLGRVIGQIRFEDVHFAYPDGHVALEGVDFTIEPGLRCAFVGRSGAGKSTVFNLLPRLYDPTSGRILIDGRDIRTLTLASLRDQVAVVSQDSVLLSGTVAENIGFGRRSASRGEIEAAARDAAADGFIRALPDGYDTQVVPTAGQFSGGERQRLSIARAFLRDAPILLLDEPTSALDAESEAVIRGALDRLARGRTTLVIAHRLSTVLDADMIVVMDRGRIVEQGTHAELLELGGSTPTSTRSSSPAPDPWRRHRRRPRRYLAPTEEPMTSGLHATDRSRPPGLRARTRGTSCRASSPTTSRGLDRGRGLRRAALAAGQVPLRLLPGARRRRHADRRQGRPRRRRWRSGSACTACAPGSRSSRPRSPWSRTRPPPGRLADPRHPALGWRACVRTPAPLLAGLAPLAPGEMPPGASRSAVPETGVELLPDDSYILEMGFERLNGVDFRKGCYVGQEVTARMKHKTELRKGLVRVRVEGEAPPPGTEIRAGDKPAGTLHSTAGGQGARLPPLRPRARGRARVARARRGSCRWRWRSGARGAILRERLVDVAVGAPPGWRR